MSPIGIMLPQYPVFNANNYKHVMHVDRRSYGATREPRRVQHTAVSSPPGPSLVMNVNRTARLGVNSQ